MASNAQKTPFVRSITEFADKEILDAIQALGRALPCHVIAVNGQIVTVAFDIANTPFTLPTVSMPVATSIYDWEPIQVGDKGYTAPADAYLGGVSGLGGGVADLSAPANLAALVFTPVSNATWSVPDANQRVVQGPTGVLIRDTQGRCTINLTPTGITCTIGDTVLEITTGAITATTETFTVNAPTIFLNGQLSQGTGDTSYAATLQGPVTVREDVTAIGTSLHGHVHTSETPGSPTSPPL